MLAALEDLPQPGCPFIIPFRLRAWLFPPPPDTNSMTKVTHGKNRSNPEMCEKEEKETNKKGRKYHRTYLPQLSISVALAISGLELRIYFGHIFL